uniref:Uncharacterized protein n=1 Tax=Arundo donax TaxID=35708 RepID=A0A0A9EWE9_ARUDO
MWRALTCTAFTAFLEESTMPFVKEPKTPDCAVVGEVLPSALSSCWATFGDRRNPRPLVKRAKVFFPVGDS